MEIVAHIRAAKDFPIEMILYVEYDAELEIQPGGGQSCHAPQCMKEDGLETNRKGSEEKCENGTALPRCVPQRHPS